MRTITYCSFANNSCLGVCILNGYLDPIEAAKEARHLGINPGGQLLAIPCHDTDTDIPPEIFEIMWSNRNRLIPAEEARTLFDAKNLHELETETAN